MKHLLFCCAFCCLLFHAHLGFSIVLYDNNLDGSDGQTYYVGDSFGVVDTIVDISDVPIPITGGTIADYNGNQMVELQGIAQNYSADFGVPIDMQEYMLYDISFDFFVDYNEQTQSSLFAKTTFNVALYLVNGGQLLDSLYLLNVTYEGFAPNSVDVSFNPELFFDPFGTSYSMDNMAHFSTNLQSYASYISQFDAVYLMFTMSYPEEGWDLPLGDPYESTAFVDNITFTATDPAMVPEPATWTMLILGIGLFRAVRRRLRF